MKKQTMSQTARRQMPYIKNAHPNDSGNSSLCWTAAAGYTLFAAAILLFAAGFLGYAASISPIVFAFLIVASLLLICLRRCFEWERAVVLRLGKFHKVKGPGLYFMLPFIDKAAYTIDIRIRVTDFSAQGALTRDSVTVAVDALCFWLVWDPQKAACEVAAYEEAVVLSSKTALRNAVSSHDLSTFLERGDVIAKSLQEEVDKKTTDWGITVLYIEIHDIQIPKSLQVSLSRLAQAEREKKARIMLADAEIEIAKRLQEAVAVYAGNDNALKLKVLSILNEGLKEGNSMILVPNSLTEELKTRDVFGLEALKEIRGMK